MPAESPEHTRPAHEPADRAEPVTPAGPAVPPAGSASSPAQPAGPRKGRGRAASASTGPGGPGDLGRLALSRSATDRDAQRRSEPRLLEELAADPATRILLVDARGRVALDVPGRPTDPPDDGLAPPDSRPWRDDAWDAEASVWQGSPGSEAGRRPRRGTGRQVGRAAAHLPRLSPGDLDLEGLTTFYLGRAEGDQPEDDHPGDGDSGRAGWGGHDGRPAAPPGQPGAGAGWLAVVVPPGLEIPDAPGQPRGGADAEGAATDHPDLRRLLRRHPLAALRAVGAQMSAQEASLAVAASALAAWHAGSPYCPACGGRTQVVQAGWARRCAQCQAVHFPRTDPAVIMAVTDDADRLLLVHGAAWEDGRYSVVAGFVEAGESAESAVVREVMEETGLRVGSVDSVEYVASQPWPFPRSLMLGYRARLAPGQTLARPDGQEVTGALLVSREELAEAVAQQRVILPGGTSFGRFLIEEWFGGPVPG